MKEWSDKEDQAKKDKTALNNCLLADIEQIKFLFKEENQIAVELIDKLLRQIMSNYEKRPEQNMEIIRELLLHADLNFINSQYNDSNILMNFCEKGEPLLVNMLLDGKYYNTKKKKQTELDLFKFDKNNENFLHYLFNNNEFETDEIFESIMIYATNNTKNKNKLELLTKEDKNGITPLVIILRKGWYKNLKIYFKYFEYKPHIIKSSRNNYIHCAIEGKNIKCLKLILKHCSLEELNQQNNDGLNPNSYAKEKKYNYMSELIKQFQNDFNNEELKNLLLLPRIDTDEIIQLFMDKNYSDTQKYLSKYKINQSISTNMDNKYSNIAYEWNSLLAKRYDIFNKGIRPEHILSKFIKNNKNNNNLYQNKKNVIVTLYEFNKFFNKYINELAIKDHIDEENYPIDIVIYNKIIYYYKISDYDSFLKNINLYFQHIYQQYENNFINESLIKDCNNNDYNYNYNKIRINYYKYITFVNISFLLVEYFIKENNEHFSQIIMDTLDKYFTENSMQIEDQKEADKKKDNYIYNIDNKKIIIKYLNDKEVLHPLNATFEDSLCYLYLLEVFLIIKFNSSKSEVIRRINKLSNIKFINDKSEEEKDEEDEEEEAEIEDNNIFDDINLDNNRNNLKILNNTTEILKKVKTIMKNSNLLNNFRNRFKMFYYELKSYLYYLSGYINKSMNKIFNIKKKFIVEGNIKSNEHKLFYYNSQGIINLRLKKYKLAEHFFKLGINLFKAMHNNLNTPDIIYHNDIVINKSEYLLKMKYNLGLTYFLNNNYLESFNIFNELKDTQEIKNNIFFWFRLGLSSLNLYLFSMRKIKQKNSKFYQNLNNSKFKDIEDKTEENDSYDSENNSVDELYEEYEKIYGNHDNLDIFLQNYSNRINKIFIETNNKKIYEYNNYDKKIDFYLDTSINSFKRVINIYKKSNYLNDNKKKEDLKGIYNFYTKNIGETKEFKNIINRQNINKRNNIPKSLIYSCYLNLLFSYSLKKRYIDIILLIKNIKKEKNLSNSIKRKIKYYELLALININKNNKAEELINEEMNKYGNIDKDSNNDFDCFNANECQIEKDINHKLLLQIGQVFIDYKNIKYEDAENKLLNIIENNYNGNEDISRYYYKLMIYILSSQNKKSKTIKLIKYRWKQIQNNNNNTHIKDNNG